MATSANGGTFVNILHAISEEIPDFLWDQKGPALARRLPDPDDLRGWSKLQELVERLALPQSDLLVERFAPAFAGFSLGGVPVLDVRPRNWKEKNKVAIYTHGGGFTLYSAASTLGRAALFADDTGLRVISVDYTLAPSVTFEEIRNQVVIVFRALMNEGYHPEDTVMFGDSSGGALVVAVILELRNLAVGLPAAAVLISPCIDLLPAKNAKDKEESDPSAPGEKPISRTAADAYAKTAPGVRATSIYADFSKGFSPTLIQGSTKEVLLSQFFRLYHALDLAGVRVKLDLYKGILPGFQFRNPDGLESKTARRKIRDFVRLRTTQSTLHDRTARATMEISKVAGEKSGEPGPGLSPSSLCQSPRGRIL